ncbi:MAG: hypothetical protein L0H63_00075 [Nitrococcus sp.]|nr:hypothetical protein [Nitrococcus sp.]
MRIEIHAERFRLNRSLYRYIRRKVLACIGEWQIDVRKVMVSLTDVARSSGRIQKRCRVEMVLDGLPGVICHQVDGDAFRAIDRSMARLHSLLQRTLRGERAGSRLPIQAPALSHLTLEQGLDS